MRQIRWKNELVQVAAGLVLVPAALFSLSNSLREMVGDSHFQDGTRAAQIGKEFVPAPFDAESCVEDIESGEVLSDPSWHLERQLQQSCQSALHIARHSLGSRMPGGP